MFEDKQGSISKISLDDKLYIAETEFELASTEYKLVRDLKAKNKPSAHAKEAVDKYNYSKLKYDIIKDLSDKKDPDRYVFAKYRRACLNYERWHSDYEFTRKSALSRNSVAQGFLQEQYERYINSKIVLDIYRDLYTTCNFDSKENSPEEL